jgi:tRNA threonylcarbamoyladenosine biosynthesis protein TsaE
MNFSKDDLDHVAQNIAQESRLRASWEHATLITFSGDLGAGKTTLIQTIARHLGVTETLQSPTFVIYKIYDLTPDLTPNPSPARRGETHHPWKKFIHGDMYRLESSDEIKKLGWEQLLADPENIICIEWPEKIADAIPDWVSRVTLHHQGEDTRSFDIHHEM